MSEKDVRDSADPVKNEPSKNAIPGAESKVDEGETPQAQVDSDKNVPSNGSGHAEMDPANLHYEGDVCIYTDPESKFQYQWEESSQQWLTKDGSSGSESITSNPTAAPDGNKDYVFDGESYTYKDATSGVTYKWNQEKNVWLTVPSSKVPEKPKGFKKPKQKEDDDIEENDTDEEEEKEKNVVRQDMTSGHYDYDGENHTYTDPKDGTVFFWDRDKNAWFPKVDDDFMAQYQMSYGFVDNQTPSKEEKPTEEEKSKTSDLKRKPQDPQWFDLDERSNTKVYVSNLPLDITEQEFVDLMQKCGLVMKDVDNGKMKVKLYHEPGNNKQLKGDGLCTYIKRESVELALKILDGSEIRGCKIKVEVAKFELKGAYNPSLKPKKKKRKDKEKLRKAQEKLFDWRPDKLRGERSKHERTVIIKNLFDPKVFDTDVGLILEFQQDLREEGSKCGNVRKVVIYDRHPEGVAQITFREPEEADACVQLFNNRWFNKRQIVAETWDGKTKYRIAETTEETEARLAKWSKFLESEEGKKSGLVENPYPPADDLNQDSDDEEQSNSVKQDVACEKFKETGDKQSVGTDQADKDSTKATAME